MFHGERRPLSPAERGARAAPQGPSARDVRREGFTNREHAQGNGPDPPGALRQALAAERAGGPTEEAEHPSATARTIRASPEHEPGPNGPPDNTQLKHPTKGYLI